MQEAARVGLVLLRAPFPARGQAEELRNDVQADEQVIIERLSRRFTILGPWVVQDATSLEACQRELPKASLDLVLLAFQSWVDDAQLAALANALGSRPLVLWCFLPWRRMPRMASYREVLRSSGTVSAFSALGLLRNLEVPFLFTWGAVDDPRLARDLDVAARAARVRGLLRSARFGLLPSRKVEMQSTLVDEGRLQMDFGPVVEQVPVEAYRLAAEAVPQEAVTAYLANLRQSFTIAGVEDACLERASRAALGLARLASERGFSVLGVNDASPAVRDVLQLRPGLYPEPAAAGAASDAVLYIPEADLGGATAAFILNRLTGSPVMFIEFWFWDEAMNQIVGGHGGLQDPALGAPGEVWISRDYEDYGGEAGGAQVQMIARSGRVTLFQLRSTPGGWQAVAASGITLESRPAVEGFPHALVRLDTPVVHFLNRLAEVGTTHHWIMAYGSVLDEIEAFCQIEQIPLEILRY